MALETEGEKIIARERTLAFIESTKNQTTKRSLLAEYQYGEDYTAWVEFFVEKYQIKLS